MVELVIWGASGHAKVVADIFRITGVARIAGFLDDCDLTRRGEAFCGAEILGGADRLGPLHQSGVRYACVAFGDNRRRLEAAAHLEAAGFSILSAVHPTAVVATDAVIGEGTVIAAGAVVNSSARIGRHVIVNTNASVDHDCIVEDGGQISPGVNLGGNVKIGSCATIGIGAVVIEKVTVGANSIVGAGGVVIADVPANVLVAGVPARIKKAVSLFGHE